MSRLEIKAAAKAQLGGKIFGNAWMMALLACLIFSAIMYVAGLVVVGTIVIAGPLTYGLSYIFLKRWRDGEKFNLADLFSGFTSDFGQNFLIGLMTAIFTMLWSLLFVIPGIVKYYAYSAAYYIKADNPDYTWRECINASRELMRGHKWDRFVLDLSFIGWYIVGSICLGIGTLWVVPYHQMAAAVFYDELLAARIADGGAQGDSWYQV